MLDKKITTMFRPKLFDTLKNYNRSQFGKDLMAGIIVGIVALPLAIAFAIASGVSPEKGLCVQVMQSLKDARLLFAIGKANVTSTFEKALERSRVILQ
jgi:hypothetical protein